MKKVYLALITPFTPDNLIDYVALERLIKLYIKEGCDGFVVCGTTGESSTLSEKEKFEILEFVVEQCKGKVEIIFGCGSNNTAETLRLCRKAQNYNIDSLLLVTPYYNKPSQDGLYQHYSCIAQNCDLPIILYQVESRCGCKFEVETLRRLHEQFPQIYALKYASYDLEKVLRIHEKIPTLTLYCGNDDQILECDELGMEGVISVIGHIVMSDLISFYKKNNKSFDGKFKKISSLVFVESNPIGIKYILAKKGLIYEKYRLPLTSLSQNNKELLDTNFAIF